MLFFRWSQEIYLIDSVLRYRSPIQYRLRTQNSHEQLTGAYYRWMLQAVQGEHADTLYGIEKIISSRIDPVTNEKYYLVKFKNLPSSQNQYIAQRDMINTGEYTP